MDTKNEGGGNEVLDAENEGLDLKNEGLENYALPPEQKIYCLRNPPTICYNYGRYNRCSKGWINLIVGARALHNVATTFVNVVNAIDTFVEPNPPTNIIKNETILTQYSIKQGLKVSGKKVKAAV